MLVEFSVENYLSFKERVTFSMLASSDKEHEDANVITLENGKRYLKTAAVYGANASGKSNLLKAMSFLATFVRESHQKQIGTPTGVIPFKLDTDCLNKPSKFDIIFYNGGVRYAYGFSATDKTVVEEYLYYYPNGRQSIIFERANINEYRFTDDKEKQNSIKMHNTENKLYLSTAANWNYEKVRQAFNWLKSFYSYDDRRAYLATIFKYLFASSDCINLVIKWIQSIDTGIIDITIDESLAYLDKDVRSEFFRYIDTYHNMYANGLINKVKFSMLEESEGTRKFFLLAIVLANSIYYGGHVTLVDEMDTHLHPLLLKYIVEIHNNSEKNPFNAQLIFTAHDANLLDLDLFRRDQIWFTEKNPNTGATDLFSLYDFGVRKDVNIEKGYLIGRYGAIPFIGGNIHG